MISIRRYLYGAGADPPATASEGLLALSVGLLEAIRRHVLSADRCDGLAAQLAELEGGLQPDMDEAGAAPVLASATRILGEYQATVRQNATASAVEMQHIVGMLNQALMTLAGGSQRSVSRLQQIQQALERSSLLQDIVSLKSSLTETVRFVEAESARERQTAAQELAALESEAGKARAYVGKTFKGLAGREEGIRALSAALEAIPPGQALYLVAFHFDRMHAAVQRYGPAVADELMFQLIKERVQPLEAAAVFQWTAADLVGMLYRSHGIARLRTEMAELNRTPLVHHLALGNRTAVLTLSPSHMVARADSNAPGPLIEEIDIFTGVRARP